MKLLNGLLVVAFVSMLAISCKDAKPAEEVVEEAPVVEEVAVDTTVVADTVAVAEEVVAQ
ncbi:MAG: hypothetical protein NDI80_00430 [Flavobacteriaceae bacterium]|nr:hypothetical protein [Flavobacteriaceae bacterium]